MAELSNMIKLQLEYGNVKLGIFVDLKKAFDSVNHEILCNKLKMYGIRDSAFKWFHSYLSNRYQYVEIDEYKSNYQVITTGVPQGSILGPILFILYINDISECLKYGTAKMYADDTNIFYVDKNLKNLEIKAQQDLDSLSTWCCVYVRYVSDVN